MKKIKIFVLPDGTRCKAMFDTRTVSNGDFNNRRVKHCIYRDSDDATPGYWHESTYLSEFEEGPEMTYTRYVSERVFFGKYRLVRERVIFMPDTWQAIAEAVKEMQKITRQCNR